MATLAFDGFVFVSKRILGVPIMVEGNLFPISFRVTGNTFLSEVSFVRIVFFMAGQAI